MSEPSIPGVQSAELEFKLAIAWQHQGQLARAAAGYRKAIALQPEYIPAYMELADLLETGGKLAEAVTVYRRAVECNPHDPGLQNKLTSLLRKQERLAADPVPTANPRQAVELSSTSQRGHILFYSDRPGIMGAEQINHLLMCGLAAAGYRVTCTQNKTFHHLIAEREQLGMRHVWLAVDDVFDTKKSRALNHTSEPQAIVTAVKPDLIIFGDGCPVSSFTAKQVAAHEGIPYVVIVHCATPGWATRFAPYLGKLAAIYERARAVIAVSQENLDLLRQLFGLPQSNGQVIYNGRPAVYFTPPQPAVRHHLRQQLGIPAEAVVCFTSARMDFVKGYQHQIEAIKQLRQSDIWPRLYFVWAGAGSVESRIRAMAMKINADSHIKFLGERSDVAAILDVADMFILPSHWEGMPLSIMEAMAKGLPVMATAISGIPEELGTTGKLLPDPEVNPSATVEEMAATIRSWVTDAQLRQQIGGVCKQRAEEQFRAERMLEEYLQIVDQAMFLKVPSGTISESAS